jgi:acetolactate synthase-1/2/3 large subunit
LITNREYGRYFVYSRVWPLVLQNMELARSQSGAAGHRARSLLARSDPIMDWVSIASGFGMAAARCETAESFDSAFARAMTETGPSLIEAVIG